MTDTGAAEVGMPIEQDVATKVDEISNSWLEETSSRARNRVEEALPGLTTAGMAATAFLDSPDVYQAIPVALIRGAVTAVLTFGVSQALRRPK